MGMNASVQVREGTDPNGAGCRIDNDVQEQVCSTSWFTAEGDYRANDPLGAPCPGELSKTLVQGRRRLKGLYSSCRHRIVTSDVPNNDLGVIQNFRDIVKAAKPFKGQQELISATFAAPTTLTLTTAVASDRSAAVGVYVKLAFQYSLTQASVITVAISNLLPPYGTDTTNVGTRSLSFSVLEACSSLELFVPFAAADGNSTLWAPRMALLDADGTGNSAISISGVTAAAGTAFGQFVSANNPVLAPIAGVMNNG